MSGPSPGRRPNVEGAVRIQAEATVWSKIFPEAKAATMEIKSPCDSLTRLLPGVTITGARLLESGATSEQKIEGKDKYRRKRGPCVRQF